MPAALIPVSQLHFEDMGSSSKSDLILATGFGCPKKAIYQGKQVTVKSVFQTDTYPIDVMNTMDLFMAEINKLRDVEHECVAQFYGFTMYDMFASVQEYFQMGNLQLYILQNPDLSWRDRHSIAIDIARGMDYLHNKPATINGEKANILHMELRSENIMICMDVDQIKVRAKIANIGFATLAESALRLNSVTEPIIKELRSRDEDRQAYIPPEMDLYSKFSKRSDIYSYGVILLELATLETPAVAKKLFWPEIKQMGLPSSYNHCMEACLERDYHRRPHFDHILHNFTKYGDRIKSFKKSLFQTKISKQDFLNAMKVRDDENSEKIDIIVESSGTHSGKKDYSDFDVAKDANSSGLLPMHESPKNDHKSNSTRFKISDIRSYISMRSQKSNPSESMVGNNSQNNASGSKIAPEGGNSSKRSLQLSQTASAQDADNGKKSRDPKESGHSKASSTKRKSETGASVKSNKTTKSKSSKKDYLTPELKRARMKIYRTVAIVVAIIVTLAVAFAILAVNLIGKK